MVYFIEVEVPYQEKQTNISPQLFWVVADDDNAGFYQPEVFKHHLLSPKIF